MSTLTKCATVAVTNMARRLFWSWVSSKENTMAANGDLVTPPNAPAIPCPVPK
jgi:hypothetical protein